MQQATCIATANKTCKEMGGAQAAPTPLMSRLGLTPAIVRQAFVRRSFRSFAGGGAVPLMSTGELTINIHRLNGTL